MNRKQKRNLIRICIAAALLVIVNILRHVTDIGGTPGFVIYLCAYLVIYLVIGYDILRKAGKGIINGRPFDEAACAGGKGTDAGRKAPDPG